MYMSLINRLISLVHQSLHLPFGIQENCPPSCPCWSLFLAVSRSFSSSEITLRPWWGWRKSSHDEQPALLSRMLASRVQCCVTPSPGRPPGWFSVYLAFLTRTRSYWIKSYPSWGFLLWFWTALTAVESDSSSKQGCVWALTVRWFPCQWARFHFFFLSWAHRSCH